MPLEDEPPEPDDEPPADEPLEPDDEPPAEGLAPDEPLEPPEDEPPALEPDEPLEPELAPPDEPDDPPSCANATTGAETIAIAATVLRSRFFMICALCGGLSASA